MAQADELRSKIALVEASKAESLKQERSIISSVMETEVYKIGMNISKTNGAMDEVTRELYQLQKKLNEAESAKETEDNKVDSSIFDKILFIGCNKKEMEFKKQINQLNQKLSKLEDSEADAVARLAAKDKDVNDIMKCLNGTIKLGKAREDDLRSQKILLMNGNESLKKTIENLESKIVVGEKVVKDLKLDVIDQKEKCNHYAVKLNVEKELRARAEEKEDVERNERISCSAQMFAMTKDHEEIEAQLKCKIESMERQWRERFESKMEICDQKENDVTHMKEFLTGLNAEKKNLMEN